MLILLSYISLTTVSLLYLEYFQTNTILNINYETGEISRVVIDSLPQTAPERGRFVSAAATKSVCHYVLFLFIFDTCFWAILIDLSRF
jgi:hypothetical protein